MERLSLLPRIDSWLSFQAGSPSKAILEGKIEDLQKKIATLEEECSESRRFAGQLASLNVLLAKMQDNLSACLLRFTR